MQVYLDPSGKLNFSPFKNEQNEPGIKVHNPIEAFFRRIGAAFGIGSGVVELKPDGQKKLYLNKRDTIAWVNRHVDADQKICEKKIKGKVLVTKVQSIYDAKLGKTGGVDPTKSTAPPSQVEIIKGGFPNVGMTSYLSIAMHHLNAALRSLPPPPLTENMIKQVAGESQFDFEKRKKCITHILEMLKTVNSGKNCTPQSMQTLHALLSQINPAVIYPDLKTSGGGDSKVAFDLLCKLVYPNDEVFFGGSRWHQEQLDKVPPSGFDPAKDAKLVFAERPFGVIGGIPEVLPSETCEVKYALPNKVESFPHFFTFSIASSNGKYAKDFPETFELSVKDGSIPNAKYELVGMTIKGPDHSYLEKVNGKWVQYESTAIIKELNPQEKASLVMSDQNRTYMPFYRRMP